MPHKKAPAKAGVTVRKSPRNPAKLLDARNMIIQHQRQRKPIKNLSSKTRGIIDITPTHAGYVHEGFLYDPNDAVANGTQDTKFSTFKRPLKARRKSFNTCSDTGACYLISDAISVFIKKGLQAGLSINEINKDLKNITTDELLFASGN